MKNLNSTLKSSTIIPALFAAGLLAGGGSMFMSTAQASGPEKTGVNPAAVSRAASSADGVQVAACNPCAAKKNPCNPCAAANPCNPCAAANPCNPCNPCAAGGGSYSQNCVVPRLASANPCAAKRNACNPCNPCAAKKNACNPCAAKKAACNPCNPCAAKKNPCNPCAAANPCNPCAAKNPCNPCNPCAAGEAPELTAKEAIAAYDCIRAEMTAGYVKAGIREMAGYTGWENVATSPYVAATHGNRFVNNWVNAVGAERYKKYEDIGQMPVGSVIAKDSFTVHTNGKMMAGPMFLMEKMENGFAPKTGNWRYTMVMPDGTIFGRTKGNNSEGMAFCAECHEAGADGQDYLLLLPEENRK